MNKIFTYLLVGLCSFLLFSCEKENEHPIIKTFPAQNVTSTDAILRGKIEKEGSYEIQDYGFVFGSGTINPQYTTSNYISLGSKIEKDTIHYLYERQFYENELTYRAYIKNTKGYLYAESQSFNFQTPSVSSLSIYECRIGDTISIKGNNFGSSLNSVKIILDNYDAQVVSIENEEICFIVPTNLPSYDSEYSVKLRIGNANSIICGNINMLPFYFGFTPTKSLKGIAIKIEGKYLLGNSYKVLFNNIESVSEYLSNNYFYVNLPDELTDTVYNISIICETDTFTFDQKFDLVVPNFESLDIQRAYAGMNIRLSGEDFYKIYHGKVLLGESLETECFIEDNILTFRLPSDISDGTYPIFINLYEIEYDTELNIEVLSPYCSEVVPDSGKVGSTINFIGENFLPPADNLSLNVKLGNRRPSINELFIKNENLIEFIIPQTYEPGQYQVWLRLGSSTVFMKDFTITNN